MDNKVKLAFVITIVNIIIGLLAMTVVSQLWYAPSLILSIVAVICSIVAITKNKAWGIVMVIINLLVVAYISSPLLLA